jgi:hypothetical protein
MPPAASAQTSSYRRTTTADAVIVDVKSTLANMVIRMTLDIEHSGCSSALAVSLRHADEF